MRRRAENEYFIAQPNIGEDLRRRKHYRDFVGINRVHHLDKFRRPQFAKAENRNLNPVRAWLLGAEERLLSYPWSGFAWYLAAPAHRPAWIRVGRWLGGAHGIAADTAEEDFE